MYKRTFAILKSTLPGNPDDAWLIEDGTTPEGSILTYNSDNKPYAMQLINTGTGKILASLLPTISIVEFLGDVASQIEMLELTGEKGDWWIRTDLGASFMITGDDPSVIGSWTEWGYPAYTGTADRITVGNMVIDLDEAVQTALGKAHTQN